MPGFLNSDVQDQPFGRGQKPSGIFGAPEAQKIPGVSRPIFASGGIAAGMGSTMDGGMRQNMNAGRGGFLDNVMNAGAGGRGFMGTRGMALPMGRR